MAKPGPEQDPRIAPPQNEKHSGGAFPHLAVDSSSFREGNGEGRHGRDKRRTEARSGHPRDRAAATAVGHALGRPDALVGARLAGAGAASDGPHQTAHSFLPSSFNTVLIPKQQAANLHAHKVL